MVLSLKHKTSNRAKYCVFHLYLILILLRVIGFRFKVADSRREEDLSYALRYRIYSEAGFIDPGSYPDERLRDRFDDQAIHVLGYFRGRPIATARLVRDRGGGFPIEELFNIKPGFTSAQTAEVSRVGVVPELRSGQSRYARLAMLGLSTRLFLESRAVGVRFWLAIMTPKLVKSVQVFGADFEKLREYTLTVENKEARQFADGYFNRYDVHPYSLDLMNVPSRPLLLKNFLFYGGNKNSALPPAEQQLAE